ncbi:MAG: CoA pyrophosphatase [Dehalococcoidales bacterium]|nr:CoA pyrophosphatase [Dehalococcoidales bacterium]
MEEELKQFFAKRTRRYITDKQRLESAVIVPIYQQDGEYRIVFIRRTMTVKVHKGQISFPGGTRDKVDKNLLDTALREAEEEIGIHREEVTILGEMDDEITTTSNFIVTPFVARIPWPYRFTLNSEEVEKVISIPIKALLEKSCMKPDTEILDGKKVASFTYKCEDTIIWGATARILNKLLEIIKSVGN